MCTTCGCGGHDARIESTHDHAHRHDHGQDHAHVHEHARAPFAAKGRIVQLERDILEKNNGFARANRTWFAAHDIQVLNLVSSPGSGKTTLLVKSIEALCGTRSVAVIEGDQETVLDAERIRATGVPAVQINTGKGCHLDAHMVGHALETLAPERGTLLLIENVGNLVCPAAFDLGESHKVVVLSVTEGEDKPLKYPDMFRASTLLLLNKCDLLPHLDFSVKRAIEHARRVNPAIQVLQVSATTGAGMAQWLEWIDLQGQRARERGGP
jgi:hydrogenase nickel incorporation protein HypB